MTTRYELKNARRGLAALAYIDANPGLCLESLPAGPTLGHYARMPVTNAC